MSKIIIFRNLYKLLLTIYIQGEIMIFQTKIDKNNKTSIPKQILDKLTNKNTIIWNLKQNGEVNLIINEDGKMSPECEELAEELKQIKKEMEDGKEQDSDSLAKELGL